MSFLKWVGGKSQIINDVFNEFPTNINNYIEPFIGGGSILIELLNKLEKNEITISGNIYCSDINENLINCYQMIKKKINTLISELDILENINKQNNKISKKEKYKTVDIPENLNDAIKQGNDVIYYYFRNQYNNLTLKGNEAKKAALFIFLNKTCFRGLYRVGKNGFNVPYGNYKNPAIYEKEYLNKLSLLFNKYKVSFTVDTFYDRVTAKITQNDFVYLDPPYFPENKNSFVDYNDSGFNKEQHDNIILLCDLIHLSENKFLLSNSDTPYIKNNLRHFNIKIIKCKRSINSKNPGATTNEVLIKNF